MKYDGNGFKTNYRIFVNQKKRKNQSQFYYLSIQSQYKANIKYIILQNIMGKELKEALNRTHLKISNTSLDLNSVPKNLIKSQAFKGLFANHSKIIQYYVKDVTKVANWQILFFFEEALKKERFQLKITQNQGLIVQIISKHAGQKYDVLVIHWEKLKKDYVQKFCDTYQIDEQLAIAQIIFYLKLMVQNSRFKYSTQRAKKSWQSYKKSEQDNPEQNSDEDGHTMCTLTPVASLFGNYNPEQVKCNGQIKFIDHRQLKSGLTGLAKLLTCILLIEHTTSQQNFQNFINRKNKDKKIQKQNKQSDRKKNSQNYRAKIYTLLKETLNPIVLIQHKLNLKNFIQELQYQENMGKLDEFDKNTKLDSWDTHQKTNQLFKDKKYSVHRYCNLKNQNYEQNLKRYRENAKISIGRLARLKRQARQNKPKSFILNRISTAQSIAPSDPSEQSQMSVEEPVSSIAASEYSDLHADTQSIQASFSPIFGDQDEIKYQDKKDDAYQNTLKDMDDWFDKYCQPSNQNITHSDPSEQSQMSFEPVPSIVANEYSDLHADTQSIQASFSPIFGDQDEIKYQDKKDDAYQNTLKDMDDWFDKYCQPSNQNITHSDPSEQSQMSFEPVPSIVANEYSDLHADTQSIQASFSPIFGDQDEIKYQDKKDDAYQYTLKDMDDWFDKYCQPSNQFDTNE